MNSRKFQITAILIILMAVIFLPPCLADDFDIVNTKFQRFSQEWVIKLQTSYLYTRNSPNIVKKGNQYLAAYYYLDESSIKTNVKQAKESSNIYTGLLQYNEYLLQSTGQTKHLAKSGQFSAKSLKQMTEIFLYKDGSWIR